jgi:SAM-dependent methyltransferase
VPPELVRDVVAHYEAQLRAHGPTARGMDWRDEASQHLRFRVLCDGLALAGRSVHEVGAGAGHLLDHLRASGVAADYSGSDLSQAMVDAARRRHPSARFERRDWLGPESGERFDVVLGSGLFHVCAGHGGAPFARFVEAMLRRMWAAAREALAFNLMSDQVDWRVPSLHYTSPAETLDFCRRELSRHVRLRHDYPLHEYTVQVFRSPREG